jgi:transcriptional regulator with XRE-family HTH domain
MKTLAQKVDWLFDVHRSPQGKQFTYGYVQRATGGRITASYVWKLRTGAMGNPGLSALEALADFFQVPLDYFSQGGEYLEDTIRLAHGMSHNGGGRQDTLRRLAARAGTLSDDHLRAVVELAEYLGAHEQPASTG